MRFDIDTYWRLTDDQREAVCAWAGQYVDTGACFGFRLVSDGPGVAAEFNVYDLDIQYQRGDEIPRHVEQFVHVAPCPWPFKTAKDTA